MQKNLLLAISTLIGGTIGAGILGLPYVINKSGFLIGSIELILIFLAILFLNLALGEIILRTPGKHQLTGYCEIYHGKTAKYIMSIAMIIGIVGALTAYITGEGISLANLFNGSESYYAIIFFLIFSILILLGIDIAKKYEIFLVSGILISLFIIMISGFTKINFNNFNIISPSNFLIPYGAIFFSSLALPAIIESNEELEKNKKLLKKAIIIGTLIPFIIYFIFVMSIIGSLGDSVSEIATLDLAKNLGNIPGFFGQIFPIFSMATAFLILGIALKEMYIYDYKINKTLAWLLTCVPPIIIYLLGFNDFIKLITIVGGIVAGIDGLLITVIWLKAKKLGKIKPLYEIPRNWIMIIFVIIIFSIAIIRTIIEIKGV